MNLALYSDARHPPPLIGAGLEKAEVLGGALIGPLMPIPVPEAWPMQRVDAPLLGSTRELVRELWQTDNHSQSGCFEGIAYRRTTELLFGLIELDEAGFTSPERGCPLRDATETAYRRLFQLLDDQGLPHLWRVWNYLADINQETNGLERYRQFNIGRHEAFIATHRTATGNVPAACAIGLRRGPLSIAFLAGRTPARAVENPRQISAYNYPSEYGPRSPTFSRAVLVSMAGQECLFISGTASILGHRTVHLGDIRGQCHEALSNVEAVMAEANRLSRASRFLASTLSYRVYIRRAEDFPLVQQVLARRIGAEAEILYVQADICRRDLLVEIEAMASIVGGSC